MVIGLSNNALETAILNCIHAHKGSMETVLLYVQQELANEMDLRENETAQITKWFKVIGSLHQGSQARKISSVDKVIHYIMHNVSSVLIRQFLRFYNIFLSFLGFVKRRRES